MIIITTPRYRLKSLKRWVWARRVFFRYINNEGSWSWEWHRSTWNLPLTPKVLATPFSFRSVVSYGRYTFLGFFHGVLGLRDSVEQKKGDTLEQKKGDTLEQVMVRIRMDRVGIDRSWSETEWTEWELIGHGPKQNGPKKNLANPGDMSWSETEWTEWRKEKQKKDWTWK